MPTLTATLMANRFGAEILLLREGASAPSPAGKGYRPSGRWNQLRDGCRNLRFVRGVSPSEPLE
jgi:hypothetical protein